ncbi:MAG: helix-turn-helix transcriptional regulator [Polyangiaceae bacterium]
MTTKRSALFPALLRHWRLSRGMSQLDLGLAAGVSARHVSFLETGRSLPSREMILRLAGTLGVPLRDQNELLRAANLEVAFAESALSISEPVHQAISRMLAKHEPYPMLVMNRRYDVLRSNDAGNRMMRALLPEPRAPGPVNVFHALFDPEGARPLVLDWENVARALLSRLQREALARGNDAELNALLRALLDYPGVPKHWQSPLMTDAATEPCLSLRFGVGGMVLAFLVTVTVFDAPQNVALEEMRIESYFPLDDVTARACEALGG